MKKGSSEAQRARLAHLASLPDESIDLSDIPEVLDWSGAVRPGLRLWRQGWEARAPINNEDADNATIEELENIIWTPPDADESDIVRRSHAVRKRPLADLKPEDLRVALGQQVGLPYVVPRAINVLLKEPAIETRHFAGDLLQSLLNVPRAFWLEHKADADRAEQVFNLYRSNSRREVVEPLIQEAHDRFSGREPSLKWLRSDDYLG